MPASMAFFIGMIIAPMEGGSLMQALPVPKKRDRQGFIK